MEEIDCGGLNFNYLNDSRERTAHNYRLIVAALYF